LARENKSYHGINFSQSIEVKDGNGIAKRRGKVGDGLTKKEVKVKDGTTKRRGKVNYGIANKLAIKPMD